jgi:MerR family transcriptional regulator, copper efflux regulator
VTTLRIAELAERAGVRPSTLRYYEQAGLLPAERTPAGYRRYDDTALDRLAFIAAGKRLGLRLADLRDLLTGWPDDSCAEARTRLRPVLRTALSTAEHQSATLRTRTTHLHTALQSLDTPAPPGPCTPTCPCPLPNPENNPHGAWDDEPIGNATPADAPLAPDQPVACGSSGDGGCRTDTTSSSSQDSDGALARDQSVACGLSGGAAVERVREWRELLGGAPRAELPNGMRISLPPAAAGPVAALAAAEQRCCPFFTFALHLTPAGLTFEVRTTPAAAPLLHLVFDPAG